MSWLCSRYGCTSAINEVNIYLYLVLIFCFLSIFTRNTRLTMIRNAVWCLSNLCRGKNPAVDFNKVKEIKTNKTWLIMSFRLLRLYLYSINFFIILMLMYWLILAGLSHIYLMDLMKKFMPLLMLLILDDLSNF